MASFTYNAGSYGIAHRDIDFLNDTIKIMLIGTASAYTPDKDHSSMTTPAASELSVTGYTSGFSSADRKTLGSKTITNDTTNDRTVFDAADPSSWTLSTGGTVAAAIIYKHLTNDAGSTPIWYLDFTDVPTNGSTFTIVFDSNGIAYTQQ
jgi:hypothetical protein